MLDLLKRLYTQMSRLVPMDITRLLLWKLDESGQFTASPELRFTSLDTAQLSNWSGNPQYELSDSFLGSIDYSHDTCVGVYVADVLAGYLFTCDSPVAASKNSGGSRFKGIALEFPSNVRYLYKVLVVPEFRGQKLSKQLMHYAADKLQAESVEYFVTTTDWTNAAFYSAAKSVGFQSIDYAGEVVFLGKSFHRLPADVALGKTRENWLRLRLPDAVQ